jgi:hypothetical protein
VEESTAKLTGHRYLRPLHFTIGLLFVALGYIGIFIPGMPSTIFFILALGAFRRSNAKLEQWLLARPVIGPILRDWDETGAIRPKIKRIIIGVLWVSITLSIWSIERKATDHMLAHIVSGVLLLCAVGVTVFIWTRPDRLD